MNYKDSSTFILVVTSIGFAALSIAAQQPAAECSVIYDRLLANRKGPELAKLHAALSAAKEYNEKCALDPEQKTVTEYVIRQIPSLTDTIKGIELAQRFNDAGLADKRDELITTGKELLARNHPSSLDIMIVLASIGYNKTVGASATDTFNDDTLRYAKTVLDKIGSGAKSESYGAYKYSYKTKDCPDGAGNTTGWMNLMIAHITGARQKKMKDAMPYYYKAVQSGCETKDMPEIYRAIAAWYSDEAVKLNTAIMEKLKASNNEATDEIKAMDALANGYLDRAIDAYARALKSANAKAALPQSTKDIYNNRLKEVYGARFGEEMEGFDHVLTKISATRFPDPTTEVKPAILESAKPADPASAQPLAATISAKPATKPAAKTTKKAARKPQKK